MQKNFVVYLIIVVCCRAILYHLSIFFEDMSVANENGFTKEAASQSVSQGVDIGSESKPAIIIIGDHDKTIVNYLLGLFCLHFCFF